MTDKYAEIRAALEAGPTPGPWKVSSESDYPGAIDGPNDQEVLSGCGCCGSPNLAKKDADHIAACDPDTIRDLLAERDALREALQEAINALSDGLWDYGPDQDEHDKCNEVIERCRAALAQGEV